MLTSAQNPMGEENPIFCPMDMSCAAQRLRQRMQQNRLRGHFVIYTILASGMQSTRAHLEHKYSLGLLSVPHQVHRWNHRHEATSIARPAH